MENKDTPAMPISDDVIGQLADFCVTESMGFTKREQVLKDFMAAMLGNPNMDYGYPDGAIGLATDAMRYTDAYFKELEK